MGVDGMKSANRLIAGLIAVTVAALCAGALLGGVLWGSQEVLTVPAKFKVGECFRSNPPLHRWQAADGQVFDLDATAYLVVYALSLQSKRPIEPAYQGAEVSIAAFDRQNEIVPCPGRW
jgi:hypothetical protein